MNAYEKLIFKLVPDEDGYPPVSTEAIWGERVGVNQYKVDNVPYYVYGVSKGDVVKVENINGEYVVSEVVIQGGHSTLRVYVEEKRRKLEVVQAIAERGGVCSVSSEFSLFPVDIPPEVDFRTIDEYLNSIADDEFISYEDACLQHLGIDSSRVLECFALSTLTSATH
ncbi:DUF4265 domain-containing protein [Pseudomonas sichuanensis]|uniref:DUF4265 domain-containing protein n=1 Tax=Pseudomonas sichuanensis TaxID=2213015 RepID=UPI00215E2C14|nr:DUF4265 domain-containing protein [Pseudomonas sichuanensis]UVK82391.1 DUF4265 domain-containing protein [Pseudomonas sichuanensis]